MLAYLLRRLAQIVVLLFAMSLVVFFGVYAIGDPVEMLVDPNLGQEARDEAVRVLGLDRPLLEQYLTYLDGLRRGDFGRSFIYGESALRIILERAPATFRAGVRGHAVRGRAGDSRSASSPGASPIGSSAAPCSAAPSSVSACPRSGWD